MKRVYLALFPLFIIANTHADVLRYVIDLDIDHYYNVMFNDEVTSTKNPNEITKSQYLLDISNDLVREQRVRVRDILKNTRDVKQKLEIESFRFALDNNLHATDLLDDQVETKEARDLEKALGREIQSKIREIDNKTNNLLFQTYMNLSQAFFDELSASYSQYEQDPMLGSLYSKSFEYPHLDKSFLSVNDDDSHLKFCQKYGFNKVSKLKSRSVRSICTNSNSTKTAGREQVVFSGQNIITVNDYQKCLPVLTDLNALEGFSTNEYDLVEKITCENSQDVGEKVGSFINKFDVDVRHVTEFPESQTQVGSSSRKVENPSTGVK